MKRLEEIAMAVFCIATAVAYMVWAAPAKALTVEESVFLADECARHGKHGFSPQCEDDINTVPEPGTIYLVISALGVLTIRKMRG